MFSEHCSPFVCSYSSYRTKKNEYNLPIYPSTQNECMYHLISQGSLFFSKWIKCISLHCQVQYQWWLSNRTYLNQIKHIVILVQAILEQTIWSILWFDGKKKFENSKKKKTVFSMQYDYQWEWIIFIGYISTFLWCWKIQERKFQIYVCIKSMEGQKIKLQARYLTRVVWVFDGKHKF